MKNSYNIIFAGTPGFAATILEALISSPHNIVGVYTQPDRPAGRGQKLTASAVKEVALQHNFAIYQPDTLRNVEQQQILADLNADLMIVVAYGLLLPKPVLQAPKLGCINVHASLLPRWRGAAPIQRSILAGDVKTGVTIMQMEEGLDTGPMLYKSECFVGSHTSQTLHDELAVLGAEALLKTLENLTELQPELQDNNNATYAHKITKEEARINWNLTAVEINRLVHGFNPWPVAFFEKENAAVRVWESAVVEQSTDKAPGTIVKLSNAGIEIATGNGVLQIQKLQFPGGKIISAADVVNSQNEKFSVGKTL